MRSPSVRSYLRVPAALAVIALGGGCTSNDKPAADARVADAKPHTPDAAVDAGMPDTPLG